MAVTEMAEREAGWWFVSLAELKKFPIYSMKEKEKLGVLCIYGMWVLHDIGRIDGEDGWNSGVR